MSRRSLTMAAGAVALTAAVATSTTVAFGGAAAKPKTVGSVTALSGSKKLQIQDGKKLKKLPLHGTIKLDQLVVMGKGVKATITLTRPKGVPQGTELVQLSNAPGTKHNVSTTSKGTKTTIKIASR